MVNIITSENFGSGRIISQSNFDFNIELKKIKELIQKVIDKLYNYLSDGEYNNTLDIVKTGSITLEDEVMNYILNNSSLKNDINKEDILSLSFPRFNPPIKIYYRKNDTKDSSHVYFSSFNTINFFINKSFLDNRKARLLFILQLADYIMMYKIIESSRIMNKFIAVDGTGVINIDEGFQSKIFFTKYCLALSDIYREYINEGEKSDQDIFNEYVFYTNNTQKYHPNKTFINAVYDLFYGDNVLEYIKLLFTEKIVYGL